MNRLFIELYLDQDVSVLVATLVRARGFKAITTQEAGLLGRAISLWDHFSSAAFALRNRPAAANNIEPRNSGRERTICAIFECK